MRPAGLRRHALALGLALIAGVQAAPTVTAQDLFDEVIYQLASSYNGPSTLRASDLRRKYLPEVQALCGGQADCPSGQAYPVVEKLLAELGDPHTNFYTPAELEELHRQLTPGPSGRLSFGAPTTSLGTGGRIVLEVLPGSPAAQAGWQVGDVFLRVNGVPLDGAAGAAAWTRVTQRGTPARFEGTRQGQPFSSAVVAAPQNLASAAVSLTTRPDGLAVLRLRHFLTPDVAQQVHDAVRKAQNARGIILDLRWNSGGLNEQFVLSAGAFMDPAPLFMKTRAATVRFGYDAGRYLVNGEVQEQPRIDNPVRYTGPLVVLVNHHTASAAELLTRTLLGRPATQVIGEATAGVGDTATRYRSLSDSSVLQLTVGRLLDPQQHLLEPRVTPARPMSLDLKELARSGKDSVIERAAQLLGK